MKKHVLWMFSQPVDEAGKSKLTVGDLIKVADTFCAADAFDDFPEDLSNIPAETELRIDASIYENSGELFFELKFWYYQNGVQTTIWQLIVKLPSEDAQWWLGVLPEFYGWPLEPQFGLFGYEFKGDELAYHHTDPDDESVGLRIFRHHGFGFKLDLRKVVGAAIKYLMDRADEYIFLNPVAFSFIPDEPEDVNNNDDPNGKLLVWEIEEHSFSRVLCPYPIILSITKNGNDITVVDDGLEKILADIDNTISAGIAENEEILVCCGCIVDGCGE